MPLIYPDQWKFDDCPHSISSEASSEFIDLIRRIAEGTDREKFVFESFKFAFGASSGSSNASWAVNDLIIAMEDAKSNAARYIASFYAGMETVKEHRFSVPTVERINKILSTHSIPLRIEGEKLVPAVGDISFGELNEPDKRSDWLFQFGERIGYGGFGEVYRVTRKTKLGEYHFAMKIFSPSTLTENKERANKRFIRELELLEKLTHRAIIPLLEAGMTAEQNPYILMPLIKGKNLRDALEGAPSIKVFRMFDEILLALDFAHNQGVLHRDLKPQNILVREADEQPFILDFGCAYLLDETEENLTTTLVGTDAYVPEEVRRDPTNRSVKQDIYACGILLYEVLARCLPRLNDYESLESQVEACEGIDKVIQRAIAPEKNRFSTVAEMRKNLNAVAEYVARQYRFL